MTCVSQSTLLWNFPSMSDIVQGSIFILFSLFSRKERTFGWRIENFELTSPQTNFFIFKCISLFLDAIIISSIFPWTLVGRSVIDTFRFPLCQSLQSVRGPWDVIYFLGGKTKIYFMVSWQSKAIMPRFVTFWPISNSNIAWI